MQGKVPQLSASHAGIQTISIGQLGLGPLSVGNLVLSNIDLSMNAAQAVLHNMTVTVTLHLSLEWHVHVGLPDGIPDIDVGDTYNLGSPTFSLPIGNVTIPGLNNLKFNIPGLNAQNVTVNASPTTLQLTNVSADDIHASDAIMPTNGFTISGMTITSLAATGIGAPAATITQATVGHLHGDAIKIPAVTLGGLQLPAIQIPSINSTIPLSIPASLPGAGVGFDGGLLRVVLHITPSVLSHIEQLNITGADAAASAGQLVLHDVTVPYDAHNLTLARIGIDTIAIPSITLA